MIHNLIERTNPGVSMELDHDHYILSIDGQKLRLELIKGQTYAWLWTTVEPNKNDLEGKPVEKWVRTNCDDILSKFLK